MQRCILILSLLSGALFPALSSAADAREQASDREGDANAGIQEYIIGEQGRSRSACQNCPKQRLSNEQLRRLEQQERGAPGVVIPLERKDRSRSFPAPGARPGPGF